MFEKQIEIPSAEEILCERPLPKALAAVKAERDALAKDVIAGKSDKLLVIVGPCSAHEAAPVLEYVRRLGRLNERVKEKLVLIPRIYTNKPRTKGVGYKGMFSQPDPENRENILKGIYAIRDLHIKAIAESGLSAADEMLYPENYAYVEDLLTYIAVGARSSENQLHRLVSSGIELPVGIKNPTGGSIPVTLNSVYAAQSPQVFKYHNWQVATNGNEYAHVVLRGRVDHYGRSLRAATNTRTSFCAGASTITATISPTTITRRSCRSLRGIRRRESSKIPPSSSIPITPIPKSSSASRSASWRRCCKTARTMPISSASSKVS